MADKDTSDYNRGNSGDMFAPGWGQVGYEMHKQRQEREKRSSYSASSQSSASGPADLSGLLWLGGILAVGTFVYQVIMPNFYWLSFYFVGLLAAYGSCIVAGYSGRSRTLWFAAALLALGATLLSVSLQRIADYSIINIFCFYAPVVIPAFVFLYYLAKSATPLKTAKLEGSIAATKILKLFLIDLGITAAASIVLFSAVAAFFESSYSFWDIGTSNDDPRRLKIWWVLVVSCHLLVLSRRIRKAG